MVGKFGSNRGDLVADSHRRNQAEIGEPDFRYYSALHDIPPYERYESFHEDTVDALRTVDCI